MTFRNGLRFIGGAKEFLENGLLRQVLVVTVVAVRLFRNIAREAKRERSNHFLGSDSPHVGCYFTGAC